MAVFALSDLHLPLGIDKPMDVFGSAWENYVERTRQNWNKTVSRDDVVIINGDVSWAMYLNQAVRDFEYIAALNGIKLISKGNHDYWWETLAKLKQFSYEHGFSDIHFLHNCAYAGEDFAVCAARGWISPSDREFRQVDEKIYNRELIRLQMSLDAGKALGKEKLIAALHYPPDEAMSVLMDEYGVFACVFGHLHGKRAQEFIPRRNNQFLVSADYLGFAPRKIM
ncbi:MAG: metallophosphoesterase [Clostridia bacterium]|nr:metallophosphoesterase [Clostridia bacterium]